MAQSRHDKGNQLNQGLNRSKQAPSTYACQYYTSPLQVYSCMM